MLDFTLQAYNKFLEVFRKKKYSFLTFSEWCKNPVCGKIVILRHDIDKKPENALKIALLEKESGIKSSYYFLINSAVFKPEIIKKIADLGHEIGYHYRDFVDAKGNDSEAVNSFQQNLEKIRSLTLVETIAMHGSPTSKYDNRKLWQNNNYRDFGIIGEPYFDFLNEESGREVFYFTDTARMWDGEKYNVRDKRLNTNGIVQPKIHSTFDLINWIETTDNQRPIMITTHPQRWTNNKIEWFAELISQTVKNRVKQLLISRN